jgi:23S rRNA-/tRNA-specific pseudouridylate synthase
MHYSTFSKSLNGNSIRSYGHLIQVDESGAVYVDRHATDYKSLEEARQHIIQENISLKLEEEVSKDLYEELSDTRIASIIKEYHDVKVTDTLIETYIKLASSRIFSVDPVVHSIRELNRLDNIVEGKLHYVLEDESVIAIDKTSQENLNKLLDGQTEIIEYMRESKENFLHVLESLGE